LFIKPEGKRPPTHKWEYKIRMDLRETGREDVDWMHLVRDQWQATVNMIINL
jgi:hypothetical protein